MNKQMSQDKLRTRLDRQSIACQLAFQGRVEGTTYTALSLPETRKRRLLQILNEALELLKDVDFSDTVQETSTV